jgi:O-antigen ligase
VSLAGSRSVFFPRATAPFALLLVISIGAAVYAFVTLSGVIALDPISELGRLAAELAVYVMAANVLNSAVRTRRLFALVALSGVVPAIIGLIQWIQGPPYVPELGVARITSTFGGGPNEFAAYMAVSALLMLGMPSLLPRLVRLPSLVLILAVLVGTYSREGWAMFLLGIVLIGWRRRRALVFGVAAMTVVIVGLVPAVQSRVLPSATQPPAAVQRTPTYASFTWRIDTWRILLDKWAQSPLIGYGLRSTPYVNPRRSQVNGGPASGFGAHNSAVNVLVEGGVVLLIPYLLLVGVMIGACVRLARTKWELQHLASLLVVVWIVVTVASLTSDDTLGETTLMYAVLALTGALEGARRLIGTADPFTGHRH